MASSSRSILGYSMLNGVAGMAVGSAMSALVPAYDEETESESETATVVALQIVASSIATALFSSVISSENDPTMGLAWFMALSFSQRSLCARGERLAASLSSRLGRLAPERSSE